MSTQTLYYLLPEMWLVAVAVGMFLAGSVVKSRQGWLTVAVGAVLVAAVVLAAQGQCAPGAASLVGDPLAQFVRWFALAAGSLLVLAASRPTSETAPEYLGTLLLTVPGVMLAASSDDLVLLLVGIELVSIPTYVLLALGGRQPASNEATLKYFLLNVLGSALFVYGLSFLYGLGGSTDLGAIYRALSAPGFLGDGLKQVAVALVFAGLGVKITAVPFHFYAPDVYQGTTHGNAALLSVAPKAVGFVVLLRLVAAPLPGGETSAWRIAAALAVLTMSVGNLVALWQNNPRRLLAYSSIAHAGYLLIALAVVFAQSGTDTDNRWNALAAMLLYLCVYAAATIGAFAALAHLGQKEEQLESLDELAGLAYTRPTLAAMLAVCMFSLAGIPPLAGFWGKLAIFGSALSVDVGPTATGAHRPWFIALAIIGALNAAVAAAYYLRVVGVLYFRVPTGKLAAAGGRGPWLAAVACTLLVITIGLYPGPLWRAAQQAQPSRRTHSPAARLEQQIMSGPRLPSATLTLPPCEGPRLRQQKGAYSSGCSLLLRSECSAGKLIVASSCKDPEGEPLSGLQGN